MKRLLVLTGIVAFAFIAFVYAETDCENQRRNAQSSAHGLKWDIQCDQNGNYKELQCTEDQNEKKRWCACYNETQAISNPSRKTRFCSCITANDRNRGAGHQCAENGKFRPTQCRGEMCHCVNAETGEKRTEPVRNPNLQC